jgi:uncharacterized protein (TIGR03437 family)
MKLSLAAATLFLVTTSNTAAWAANQVLLRNVDIGDQGSAQALAADTAANLFTVSTFTDPSGHTAMRVIKTDPKGGALASIDVPLVSTSDVPGYGPAAAAVDPSGNLVIVGTLAAVTSAPVLLPLVNPLFPSVTAGGAFVMKLDSQLHGLLFSTFISSSSGANAVAVDPAGDIFVAGSTGDGFPLTAGAFQTTPPAPPESYTRGPGASFAFLSEISPNGDRLLYSTYFGGNGVNCIGGSVCVGVFGGTSAYALAIGPSGVVAMAGVTSATDLPVTARVLGPTCYCSNLAPAAFLAEFSTGSPLKLVWSTFVNLTHGAASYQPNLAISTLGFDSAANVVVGGFAGQGLGTTPGVLQPNLTSGWGGGFAAKVSASGTGMIWSTYVGGQASGYSGGVTRLAVDSQGAVVITGTPDPSSLPPLPGTPLLGSSYVARLSSDATALQGLYVGPANSAGVGLVLTSTGRFVSLGKPGTLWIETTASGPSLLVTANSASGPVSGLIAPMELISLYGIGIGPQKALLGDSSSGTYTSMLGGYQVLFDGIAAPLLYAGPTQINAVVPQAGVLRDYTHLQVVTPSGTVDGPTLAVRQAEPYIFQNSSTGLSAALNQDGSINSPQNPAKAGDIVTIFATGGGTYPWPDGLLITNQFREGFVPVSVLAELGGPNGSIGTASLEVLYAGDAPGDVAGVMQINFRLPESLPASYSTFTVTLQVGGTVGGSGSVAVLPHL